MSPVALDRHNYQLHPCGQPRYHLRKRHHQWIVTARTGSYIEPLGKPVDTLHEAHKLIEGDIAAHRAYGCTVDAAGIGRVIAPLGIDRAIEAEEQTVTS